MSSLFKIQWIKKYIGYPKVIMDIGAATCRDSCRFKEAYPKCRVIAFEPSLDSKIKEKAIINCKCFNVEFYPIAIGGYVGKTNFYQSHKNKQSSSIFEPTKILHKRHPKMIFDKPIEVDITTIEQFCKDKNINHVDMLHIDAHGAETQIITNMGNIKPKIIFAEVVAFDSYECNTSENELNEKLENLGYILEERLFGDALYIRK